MKFLFSKTFFLTTLFVFHLAGVHTHFFCTQEKSAAQERCGCSEHAQTFSETVNAFSSSVPVHTHDVCNCLIGAPLQKQSLRICQSLPDLFIQPTVETVPAYSLSERDAKTFSAIPDPPDCPDDRTHFLKTVRLLS